MVGLDASERRRPRRLDRRRPRLRPASGRRGRRPASRRDGGVPNRILRWMRWAFVLFLAVTLSAQDADRRVQWLADHAVRLRSIAPDDVDFKDLEPLRATLKSVRVVLLGEQSHGDGNTFLVKTRLIRFLHEQMGFDVLVFESGL